MNTYKEFKKWVVDTCHTNVSKCNEKCYIYDGDTAHAIYTAWYMFKHNFTEEQVNEYIQKDIEKSHKHFYSQGFNVVFDTSFLSIIPESERILIKIDDSKWSPYSLCEGGGFFVEYHYLQKKWEKIVKAIWEYWAFKLMQEKEANNESK